LDKLDQIRRLTTINAGELLDAFGVEPGALRKFAGPIAYAVARRISVKMVDYDHAIGTHGLREGSLEILPKLVGSLEVSGQGHVPRNGPLLLATNHPGLSDVLAVFATLDRDDVRTVAADYPLLRALSGTSRHLMFIPRAGGGRTVFVREVLEHLRQGGALLLPAAGRIEPDPNVLPGAVESVRSWSRSIGVLLRHVNNLQVVPVIVSGVLDAGYQRHPLTRLRRHPSDQQRLGTALQVLMHTLPAHTVRVAFGSPMPESAPGRPRSDAAALTSSVVWAAQQLILNPPNDWSVMFKRSRSVSTGGW
jgi:hypothetical protein